MRLTLAHIHHYMFAFRNRIGFSISTRYNREWHILHVSHTGTSICSTELNQ